MYEVVRVSEDEDGEGLQHAALHEPESDEREEAEHRELRPDATATRQVT